VALSPKTARTLSDHGKK